MSGSDVAAEAAIHWLCLSWAQDARLAWERENGMPTGDNSGVLKARSRTYRLVAESLRREVVKGKSHCSACGGSHAEHEHGFPFGIRPCRCGLAECPWCCP